MPKSTHKSPTGSTQPLNTHHTSSPKTGVDSSTLRLRAASKQTAILGERSHDRTRSVGGVKFSAMQYQPIYNDAGVDVTPRPLEKRSYVDVPKTTSALIGAMDTPSSIFDHPGRSKFMSMRASVMSMVESLFDDEIDSVHTTGKEQTHPGRKDVEEQSSHAVLSSASVPLDTLITVILKETETDFLFELEGLLILANTEESELVEKQNRAYKELCASKETSDMFTEKAVQSINFLPKLKSVQTDAITQMDAGTRVTNWLMYDTFYGASDRMDEDDVDSQQSYSEAGSVLLRTHSNDSIMGIFKDSSLDGAGDSTSGHPTATTSGPSGPTATSKLSKAESPDAVESVQSIVRPSLVMKSEQLKKHLSLVDRMINLNNFQKKLAMYKHLQILEDAVEPIDAPDLNLYFDDEISEDKLLKQESVSENKDILSLRQTSSIAHWQIENAYGLVIMWSFYVPKLAGLSVNCVVTNPANPDIIGVGYGDLNFTSNKPGYAACWSLKNIRYPERLLECTCAVTAMCFSNSYPALLAVGLLDGTIMLTGVTEKTNEWLMDSSDSSEIQIGAIWRLTWIKRVQGAKHDKTEFLVSACEDAHICQWFLRKGMESVTLMRVKQILAVKKWKKADVSVAKYATVFCMAFHPTKENIYLIGTGEGSVHECSCTNSDHFVATYLGHTGTVYQVAWSPFADDLFVSCSGDWTVRIWTSEDATCLLTLSSINSIILDVAWSPVHSTILASLHCDQVEIWDLSLSISDPVSVYAPNTNTTFSVISFDNNGTALMLGDSDSRVTTLNLMNFPPPPGLQEKTIRSLLRRSIVIDKKVETAEDEEEFSLKKLLTSD